MQGLAREPNNSHERFIPIQDWASLIPDHEWAVYRMAIQAVRRTGVRFLLGGAFGLAAYTGRWRNTKDIDFYFLPQDRDRVVRALNDTGFEDYYSRMPYDRSWIYRSTSQDVIVDVIWGMPNRRGEVDAVWFDRAGQALVRGEVLHPLPPEELVWCKLYVLQRDRCDWPDIFNLLYAAGNSLDWDHLLARVGRDAPLLRAVVGIFDWLCPAHGQKFPAGLRRRLHLPAPPVLEVNGQEWCRLDLLDTRPWFAALQPRDRPMQI